MLLTDDSNHNDKITTAVGTFTKLDHHIGLVKYNGRTDVSVNEMKEFTEKAYVLMDHQPFCVIADVINNYGGFSNDVWKFLAKDQKINQNIIHTIVVSNNLGIRIQINFFLKLFKPKLKVTMVNSMDKAFKLIEKVHIHT
jgi:hypothetical protein